LEAVNLLEAVDLEDSLIDVIQQETLADQSMQQLHNLIVQGWPDNKQQVPPQVRTYWTIREELTVQNDLIYKGERLVVPAAASRTMIENIHASHQGIQANIARARESMYWPGMTSQIKDYVEKCDVCRRYSDQQQKETLHPHDVPNRPWAKVGMDIFHLDERNYLITVDYFSNYWEIDYLPDMRSETVISKVKMQFSRHGIPDTVMSDNGTQFTSEQFQEFSRKWKFKHTTSSPGFPQSNGMSENAVRTAKRLLQKAKADDKDPYLAILDFRNTPDQDGYSPVQKLMSRRTKTRLPTTKKLLSPKVAKGVSRNINENKQKQAAYYNQHAKDLTPLQLGDPVVIFDFQQKQWSTEGMIVKKLPHRSYLVKLTNGRNLKRNRKHLKKTDKQMAPFEDDDDEPPNNQQPNHPATSQPASSHPASSQPATSQPATRQSTGSRSPVKTRTGRTVKRPKYLQDYQQ